MTGSGNARAALKVGFWAEAARPLSLGTPSFLCRFLCHRTEARHGPRGVPLGKTPPHLGGRSEPKREQVVPPVVPTQTVARRVFRVFGIDRKPAET